MLTPLPGSSWTREAAAHLLNRAGFGGTPAQIERLAGLTPSAAVDYLLDFDQRPDPLPAPAWTRPDPERFKRYAALRKATPAEKRKLRREEQVRQREQIGELRQWWLSRMAADARPVQEKLALFWHGHFATSAQKVKNAWWMWRQNDLFRRHGAGNWLRLLTEVSKDPAMLVWLDQAQSRKQMPNENFAREVMELFALGEGNYTEKDVSEAARAFTGWSLDRLNGEFMERPRNHDTGVKTVLGQTGRFDGDAVLKLIARHPQSARFISRKLWSFFARENPPEPLVNALAAVFRDAGLELKPLLRTIFLSEEFYSAPVRRQQVKSPVQWLVGSVRLLERPLPPERVSAAILRTLGQDLFFPPNVKGWDGGLSWITTNNLLNRHNYAQDLVLGTRAGLRGGLSNRSPAKRTQAPVKAGELLPRALWRDQKALAAELERRFLQGKLSAGHRETLQAYLDSQGELDEEDVLHAIRLVMCTPEYQLT